MSVPGLEAGGTLVLRFNNTRVIVDRTLNVGGEKREFIL